MYTCSTRTYVRPLAKSVPFDEIAANPSDLKHFVELLGCSDGLGMVILTHMHRWGAF